MNEKNDKHGKDDDARLQRWWQGLSKQERKAAAAAAESGRLPDELLAGLRQTGHPGTKAGSRAISRDVQRFVKMRHDT